jgi:hypothetical protein
VYAERGVVKRGKLQGRLCRLIELATKGGSTFEGEPFDGYLSTTATNMGRGNLLRDRCDETNYLAVVHTALLIARRIRATGEKMAAKEFLPTTARMVEEVTRECGLRRPTIDEVREALSAYRMLPDEEISQLLTQLD